MLMLHYRPRDHGSDPARLGLVVGKKFLKAAVSRNLVKRLVRERFRHMRPQLPACDVVMRLVAKPQRLDRQAVAAEAEQLFARLARRYTSDAEAR